MALRAQRILDLIKVQRTVNNTPINMPVWTPIDTMDIFVEARVLAFSDDGTKGNTSYICRGFKCLAGVLTVTGPPGVLYSGLEAPGWTCVLDSVANKIVLTIKGDAALATTWTYHATLHINTDLTI